MIRVSAFMGTVPICLSCTPHSHTSCQHVAVSEHAATCTVGSFGSQVELRVWQWTAENVQEAGIMVVEQSRVDTKKQSSLIHALLCLSSVACFYLCFTLKKLR